MPVRLAALDLFQQAVTLRSGFREFVVWSIGPLAGIKIYKTVETDEGFNAEC